MRHRQAHHLNVALAQIDVQLANVEANISKVISIIDLYRDACDIVVFPELTLTGYAIGDRYGDAALRLDDPDFQKLVSSTTGIRAAVGFIEETRDFKYFNSLALLANGKISSIHRKVYPPNYGSFDERKYFAAGNNHQCVDMQGISVAPFICADAWNPGMVHLSAMNGAHVFLLSVCSPANGLGAKMCTREGWKRLNRFYATIYGAYVIFVNRVGTEGGLRYWGESELIDPCGNVVCSVADDSEEIVSGTIDLSKIREARQILPSMRDDNPDFMRRQLSKIHANDHTAQNISVSSEWRKTHDPTTS